MNAETRKQNEIMPSGIIKLDARRCIDGAMRNYTEIIHTKTE